MVDRFALGLLGRHVPRGAVDFALLGEAVNALCVSQLDQPEVQDFDEILLVSVASQKNIVRLEVAVNDSELVRFTQ